MRQKKPEKKSAIVKIVKKKKRELQIYDVEKMKCKEKNLIKTILLLTVLYNL